MAKQQTKKAVKTGRNTTIRKVEKVDPKPKTEKPKTDNVIPESKPVKVDPKAVKPEVDKATPERPLTMVEAAHIVLKKEKKAMTCLDIVKAMKDAKLWETKTGRTPQNTMNAAINIDIKRGKNRFIKIGKGLYAAAS